MPTTERGATGVRKLHDKVAHRLATAIIGGTHKPGDTLPNEAQLAADFSVSRTALREAIRLLLAKGLINSRPRTGTRITPRTRWNMLDPDVLAWHLEADPNDGFIANLFEIRRIVEPAAAALAAERRTDEDLATMRNTMEQLNELSRDWREGLDFDIAFHRGILAAARNEQLWSFGSVIDVALRWSVGVSYSVCMSPSRDPATEHMNVYSAIEARDSEAARAFMSALVTNALKDTRVALKDGGRTRTTQ